MKPRHVLKALGLVAVVAIGAGGYAIAFQAHGEAQYQAGYSSAVFQQILRKKPAKLKKPRSYRWHLNRSA